MHHTTIIQPTHIGIVINLHFDNLPNPAQPIPTNDNPSCIIQQLEANKAHNIDDNIDKKRVLSHISFSSV